MPSLSRSGEVEAFPPVASASPVPCDVLVLGGGMAGLSAALSAAEAGASVVVLEADTEPGGAARWSSGRIWTLPDYDAFRRTIPLGDAALQRVLLAEISGALDWLSQSVGELAPQSAGKSGAGRVMTLGKAGERSDYLRLFANRVAAAGATIKFGVRVIDAVSGRNDRFVARARSGTGEEASFSASALVVATGGFQGARELLAEHLGPEARHLMLRSSPHSDGAGHAIGRNLGGGTSRGLSGFYGKSMPLHSGTVSLGDFKRMTLDVARFSIAVNAEGRRFVDEAAGTAGEAIPNAAIYQPQDGRYYLICEGSQAPNVQRDALGELAVKAGVEESAIFLEAPTAERLADLMEHHWHVDRAGLRATIAEVNRAAAIGHGQGLSPPRRVAPTSLATVPFIAIACQAAITIPFGGMRVDGEMALLASDGEQVPGVFVAGADAGGVYVDVYAGGLAWALTSGRIAGRSAAAAALLRERAAAE